MPHSMTDRVATRRVDVDLHLHSHRSDGDDSPERLAARCAESGLRVVSCTDHDTFAGYPEFRAAAAAAGIDVIPGCEITAVHDGRDVHCLAYFTDPADATLAARVDSVRQAEIAWWRTWFEQAGALGVAVSWEQVQDRFGTDRIAYLGDYLDFFLDAAGDDERFAAYPRGRHEQFIREWCKAGQALHVPRPWRPGLEEVARWVTDAGGVTVLAHPARAVEAERLPELAGLVKQAGFAGMETWTTWHSPEESDRLAAACAGAGLIATQGSDYHGVRLKPWAPEPGRVPAEAPDVARMLDDLRDACPAGRP